MDLKLRTRVSLALAVLLTLSGCIENPEDKTAREVRSANAKALAVLKAGGDADAVRKELQKALLGGKQAPSAKQTALFIGANLIFDKAEQAQTELVKIRMNIPAILEKISRISAEIRESNLERDRSRMLLNAGDVQINQLKYMLDGTDEQEPGLRSKLEDLQMRADELFKKKGLMQHQLEEAKTKAAELQQESDKLLQMAEQANQDEKALLQQRAFELLKGGAGSNDQLTPGRIFWLAKAQESLDRISDLENELATITPRIEKLTADIVAAEKRLNDIEGSASRSQMRIRLSDIQTQITDQQHQIKKTLEQLAAVEGNYGKIVNDVVELFGEAGNEYGKISSPTDTLITNIASMASADSFFRIGRYYEEYMKLQSRLVRQLNMLAESAEAEAAGELGNAVRKYAGNADKYGNKAAEYYDRAVKIYEKLHRQTGRKKDDFAHSVATNHILVLFAKAHLAEQLDKEDWRSQAIKQANKLAEQAAKSDPDFEQSITGQLLQDLK